MTQEEMRQLKLLILSTVAYYGHSIQDDVLAMYVEDLADLPLPEVADALRAVRRDPKTTRFPLPALIRDRISPAETPDADARDAAARIVSAISSCGWNNPTRAKQMIGELGWYVVTMAGGWLTVCETLTHDNVGQLQAQWRELALSSIRRAKAGTLNIAPVIPHKRSESKELGSIQEIIKQIPDMKPMEMEEDPFGP